MHYIGTSGLYVLCSAIHIQQQTILALKKDQCSPTARE